MSTNDSPSPYITVEEAARYLRYSPDHFSRLIGPQRIPHRRAGRRLLFLQTELDAWLDSHTTPARRIIRRPKRSTRRASGKGRAK